MAEPTDPGPTEGADLPIIWRVGRAGLVVSRAGIAVAAIAVLAIAAWVLTSTSADLVAAIAGGGFASFLGVMLWRAGIHPAVLAAEEALVIRNPLGTVRISWADIAKVSAGFEGVTVTRVGAPPTTAWAVQKTNFSTRRRSRTRADMVAARIWELAVERGAQELGTGGPRRVPQRELGPIDAVREPLRLPWRMTRPEAAVIGLLRHSSSPRQALAMGALFGCIGVLNAWFFGVDQWDGYLLTSRGVTVEATVVAVPGLIEVTWPAIWPETVFLETPAEDAAREYAPGHVVEIVSDPEHPTRARLVGFSPSPLGSLAASVGTVFLAGGYLKWWRWLVMARRSVPPIPPGRHRA